MVCPSVSGAEIAERNGVQLVDVGDGWVPRIGGINYKSLNYSNIYDDEKGEQLIARAVLGDPIAHKTLCSIAAYFVTAGCEMPTHLRTYVAGFLTQQSKQETARRRGRDPYANYVRDLDITKIVFEVCRLGFKPTRNRASANESACSVVGQALDRLGADLGETAVEKIWERFSGKFPFVKSGLSENKSAL